MSGICSAHQGHDPTCPRCTWTGMAAIYDERRRVIGMWNDTLELGGNETMTNPMKRLIAGIPLFIGGALTAILVPVSMHEDSPTVYHPQCASGYLVDGVRIIIQPCAAYTRNVLGWHLEMFLGSLIGGIFIAILGAVLALSSID